MVEEAEREVQKWTFDPIAELYDRARPRYPDELLKDMTQLVGIGPGTRVLEIGCGTGKLTVALAELGCEIVAVELGPNLAALARRNLSHFPQASVVTGSFEEWSSPEELFDVVVSATAFHWLDPETRVPKSADALRPGGSLAIVISHHVARDQDGFFDDSQECWNRWYPDSDPVFRLPRPEDVPIDTEEIRGSGRFETPTVRRYGWEQQYSTAGYIDLISTYSANLMLEPEVRAGLFTCIADVIDTRYDGHVIKPHLVELQAARLRS